MSGNPTKKVVISNAQQLLRLSNEYPGILELPAFQSLKALHNKPKSGGCNCNKSHKNYTLQYETAMLVLSPVEKAKLKTLLNAEEICYYTKANGSFKLTCF